ncbi:MAG TPA: DUF3617 family protein [Thermoanaerobaculia bacterium]|nr:DUF3617 family protein [Thermoanaerobaculia bacterium]
MIASPTPLPKRASLRIPATLPILALLCAAIFLTSATSAMAAGVDVHPGKWEMSTTVDVQGRLPGKDKPPVTTRCIKPEDVKDADAMVQASQKDKRCTTTVISATSEHVAWSYECPTGSGSADYAYAGDSYESTFQFTAHAANGDHKTTQHTTAHRVGDCS